jgi:hypothetical protein
VNKAAGGAGARGGQDTRALAALAARRTGRADAWEAEVLPKMKEAAVAALRAAQNEAPPPPYCCPYPCPYCTLPLAAVAALRAAQNEARPAPRPPQAPQMAQMMLSQAVIITSHF